MANTIKIVQIFTKVDLRAGEDRLTSLIADKDYPHPRTGEVFLFINRKRNIVKVLGNRGLFIDRLPDKQTFDLSLRKEQLLKSIGRYFGITFSVSDEAYKNHDREMV